jgi:hypothetical protein
VKTENKKKNFKTLSEAHDAPQCNLATIQDLSRSKEAYDALLDQKKILSSAVTFFACSNVRLKRSLTAKTTIL